ncbi:hypothetical protein CXB51_029556 [Gossypium anomalum]|uniref:Integrase catalytic domain-containing protein n=1 Tax=Gossypium anomalum TaxID=47600 RepID=A0A8J5YEK3_9ROSI|nr:hypothetical protein CXB51_029556 [Gossypium anomalum]
MGSDKTRQQQVINLRRDFENLKMKESESIKQNSDRIIATVNSIRLLGEDFSDSRVVEKVITTLSDRFESKISSLEDSRDLTTISLSELVNSLYALEQRRANRQEDHPEGAFQTYNVGTVSSLAMLRKFAKTNQRHQHSSRSKLKLLRIFKLRRCMCSQPPALHLQAKLEAIGDKNLFKDLDRSHSSKIRIGNGELIEAKGRGSLVEKGYSLVFKNGSCVIKDCHGQEMITVGMVDKCLMLDVNQLENKAYASLADNAGLWHRRLGHINFRSLDMLNKQNLVEDMSKMEASDTVCEVCQLGKQARLPFLVNQAWRVRERLELVYFMKHKSEVFEAFCKFKALVENQTCYKIKALRTDNGTEYLSQRFQKLCEHAGIHHQLTTVYTPQQNGVFERKNRTVMNMARWLLFQSKLPSKFWAEAVNTSVYLLNKLPTRAVKDKTPFEAWYGLKPSVSHLKVFGCICYTLIPAERRTKLERRSAPGIFVGYSSTKKGYRVYDPSTKKILSWEGSDASQFDEDQLDISLKPAENEPESANIDDPPVRGTRTIADIYHRCNAAIVEPSSYEEAARDRSWKKAIEAELEMIRKNETWNLVDRPDQKKVMGVKWVFRAKFNSDGSLNKHKARLVVKGYSQEYGTDFMETFAPVARLDTIKLLFALAEEIYIEQPEGFKVPGEENKVYRLKKALYDLGSGKILSEPTLYVKKTEDETLLIVLIYVDDLLVTGSKTDLINDFKIQMQEVFDMTDLGAMTYFLGMEVNRFDQGIFISQYAFALKILDKFCMTNCKSVSTPMAQGEKLTSFGNQKRVDEKEYKSLVGCLLYLTATRPDLMHTVSLLSRFMHCCDTSHFKAAKRVLRYVKGTLKLSVMFKRENKLKLIGYSDSDGAGSADDMKSTSGYFFTLGSGVFCWSSKKQQTVA